MINVLYSTRFEYQIFVFSLILLEVRLLASRCSREYDLTSFLIFIFLYYLIESLVVLVKLEKDD